MWMVRHRLALLATGTVFLLAPGEARAAFPGRNGQIGFDNVRMLSVSPGARGGLRILGPGYHPRYSPSGRLIAYGCGPDVEARCRRGIGVRLRRANGRGRSRRLTRDNWDNFPDWSPDGKSIVFTRYPDRSLTHPELWIYTRGHSRRLTQGEQPAWSTRGEIAFVRSGDVHNEPWDLYAIRPDGTQLRRLAPGFDPEWSPDGRELVYASNGCGYSCLFTIRRDGSHERRLGRGIAGLEPDFSPNGKQIVFSGGESAQIVVMRRTGRRRRVVFRAAGDFVAADPDWQSLPRR